MTRSEHLDPVAVPPNREGAARLIWYAAGLSAVASILHGVVTPQHFDEWWGYGAFFVIAAVAQMAYAVILLIAPWRYDASGGLRADGGWRVARAYCLIGVAGNAAIVALYVVTRTVGIPFFGPEAGEVEAIGVLDSISKLVELALIVILLVVHRRLSEDARAQQRPVARGSGRQGV